MEFDPLEALKARAVRLLSEAHKRADTRGTVLLDGDVARAAGMDADTREHRAAVFYLKAEGAVEEADVRPGIVGTTYYQITDRGLEMLREGGYSA